MNMRKITSLTALVSFLLEMLTSVILYIVPQGRVAYWSGWRLWGLSKTQWGSLHVNLGLLFLIAICLHTYYNWNPIIAYLKNRAAELRIFTTDFTVALILCLVFSLGTYWELVPFSTIISIGDQIKESAAKKYGEPPYGHAELSSLATFSKKVELDLDASLTRLAAAKIRITDPGQSIAEIAKMNNLTPKAVYQAMLEPEQPGQRKNLPANPPGGFGKKPLADICQEYQLDMPAILQGFADRKITATPAMSIKEIAAANNTSPMDIFEAIRQLATQN
ncbi:MAG: DUF4405 domain-containing protein [Deltaproteobacteria bacterium]|nr:DUF4405 domain-containing protein [Deltaproteobacteria bacterium]